MSRQDSAHLQGTQEWATEDLLVSVQIQGGCRLTQELAAPESEKDGQGSVGCRNSIIGTGPFETENHWREQ